jgi:REP element-mobilizing transposase RayT
MGTNHHRLPREHYQGRVWASFTLCVEERKRPFVRIEIVGVFVDFLKQVAHKCDFRAIYCFMPDHAHIVSMGNGDDSDILLGIERFKQTTGYWLKRHYPGVCWQAGFYNLIIRSRQLGQVVRYVLDNPVRAGLVTDWREYPFIGAVGLELETSLQELGPD